MSTLAKTLTTLVVIIILIVIGWMIWGGNKASTPALPSPSPVQSGQPQASNPAPVQQPALSTSGADSSDAAIQTDLSSVDSQMTALSADSTGVDQSVSSSAAP